ncbi:LacI family transcriptional regulator [Gemmiger formicilis]|uniref:LacI family DNA-binding transcriptional regulator n=1 Tax=Gemmiger formicilis TaxID=745368 RepID=UPI00210B8650|nr:LacI family DNA-binding transcriptional regulator [Gemmiger formicilis]MCQ5080002.1 LacI family transcriptional regulator [Gemmiger formicilis]MCQ5117252.1 LacI family transcriptional regulator [Gemmiger formicilis]
MPTIKDVAAAAGVSPTTVSLVMNGRGEQHRIPPETIIRIQNAMRELGYQPNLSARRLRTSAERRPVVAFFWPLDYRANMLGYFLSLIQKALREKSYDCELVVHPFTNDHIADACEALIHNNYTGAIIGAASEQDVRHLETLDTQVPIVLINRESNKYSTSSANSNKVGLLAASLIRQKNYRQVALICAGNRYVAASRRTDAFVFACQQLGIQVPQEWIFSGANTAEGGAAAAESLCALTNMPKMVLCESDTMVPGVLYTLHKYGILIPQDMELLSFATQDPMSVQYLIPAVSTVSMPSEEIARQAVGALISHITTGSREPLRIESEARVELRESFRL